jgi:hypothetical protein
VCPRDAGDWKRNICRRRRMWGCNLARNLVARSGRSPELGYGAACLYSVGSPRTVTLAQAANESSPAQARRVPVTRPFLGARHEPRTARDDKTAELTGAQQTLSQ